MGGCQSNRRPEIFANLPLFDYSAGVMEAMTTEIWRWAQKQDIGSSPRIAFSMAYDAGSKRVVLFEGVFSGQGVMKTNSKTIRGSGSMSIGSRRQIQVRHQEVHMTWCMI
jgi:hypothetical protein